MSALPDNSHAERARRGWAKMTPERRAERLEHMRAAQKAAAARVTPEERERRRQKIAAGMQRHHEERRRAEVAARVTHHPDPLAITARPAPHAAVLIPGVTSAADAEAGRILSDAVAFARQRVAVALQPVTELTRIAELALAFINADAKGRGCMDAHRVLADAVRAWDEKRGGGR
jgi:hypothetical protein